MVDADEPYTGLSAKIPHLELDVFVLNTGSLHLSVREEYPGAIPLLFRH